MFHYAMLFLFSNQDQLKYLINSYLISRQIINLVENTQKNIKKEGIQTFDDVIKYKKYPKILVMPGKEVTQMEIGPFLSDKSCYRA